MSHDNEQSGKSSTERHESDEMTDAKQRAEELEETFGRAAMSAAAGGPAVIPLLARLLKQRQLKRSRPEA